MPTYVYRFLDREGTIEVHQSFTDDALTEAVHPADGQLHPVKKVFTPVGVTFKGGGFYKNDSRGSSSSGSSSSSTSSSDSTSGSSGSGDSAGSSSSDSGASSSPAPTPSPSPAPASTAAPASPA